MNSATSSSTLSLRHILTSTKPRRQNLSLSSFHSHSTSSSDPNEHFYPPSSDLSTVEKIYRILRKHHTRPSKLSLLLSECNLTLHPSLIDRVIRRCGDAGVLGFRFFSWAAQQPDYHPSPEIYRSTARMLGKMRQFAAAWAVVDEMRRTHPELLGADIFVALIRRFASSRMVDKAINVLDEMPNYGFQPDGYVFGCLLDALCKNGSVRNAAKLFDEMRREVPPTIKHFTSLLYGWCREGRLIEAKCVLVQMRKAGFDPDVVVYNTLLTGYAAAAKMEDGYELLREMRRKGCDPNATSYTTLIQALCFKDRMDEGMGVFIDMRRNGCEPDVVTYTTLISGFCKWGKLKKAYELLGAMVNQGCEPNQTTYLHIIGAHEKKEELEECLEIMTNMRKSGCSPDLMVYNAVIRLACKLGELKQAASVWNEVEDISGLSPGLDSFVILVHGFVEQGALVEACGYFKEMVGRGLWVAPHYGTLKELLNALLRAEKLQLAEEVWGCLVEKGCEINVCAWTIWIHALFSRRYVKEACSHCIDMLDRGQMPQPDTFAKLMKGLKRLFNRRIAAEITEKVRKMAAERKTSFKMYKRRGVRMLREKEEAKKIGGRNAGGPRHRGNVSVF